MKFLIVISAFFILNSLSAQEVSLLNGPMLGYTNHREAAIWLQTHEEAEVELTYHELNAKKKYVETISTKDDNANTATIIADSLQPGTTYQYQISINGNQIQQSSDHLTFTTQELWQWKKEPPEWKMALGSCSYINEKKYDRPGKSYGGGYSIFEAIDNKSPEIMLWLGDNIYTREVDFYSLSGYQKRYTNSRKLDEMQSLLKNTNHYAIWDDHDYGPNNSDRSNAYKQQALKAFQQFWANPTYGFNNINCAVTKFKYNDAAFFLLDDRWFRSPNNRKTGERDYFGEAQLQWLVDALVSTDATFKFVAVGGQVLNSAAVYENYATYPKERKKLLNLLEKERIKNVIFLTGDRHHSELSKITRNGIDYYDFTVSPLTSSPHNAIDEPNNNRIDGTHYAERNFGIIELSGTYENRKAKLIIYDKNGKEVWSRLIKRQ